MVQKKQAKILLDVIWNRSQRRKAVLFRFHGYLIGHSLGRCSGSFQRVAMINSGYHHRTSAHTTRFPASVFGFLWSIIFGNREERVSLPFQSDVRWAPADLVTIKSFTLPAWRGDYQSTDRLISNMLPPEEGELLRANTVIQRALCAMTPPKINHHTI